MRKYIFSLVLGVGMMMVNVGYAAICPTKDNPNAVCADNIDPIANQAIIDSGIPTNISSQVT